jgi:hypothetical protein
MAAADDDALSTCSPYFRRGEGNRSKGLRCFFHSLLVAMEEERRRRGRGGSLARFSVSFVVDFIFSFLFFTWQYLSTGFFEVCIGSLLVRHRHVTM